MEEGDEFVKKDREYIKSLIERYGIKNKDILSIGSGSCDEEYMFSLYGNNTVDCVDPVFGELHPDLGISSCNKESQDTLSRLNKFQEPIRDYKTDKKYDVIYANSPGDWMGDNQMKERCCQIIPELYLDILNGMTKKKCLAVIQIRGGAFSPDIIRNPITYTRLQKTLELKTDYTFSELWIDEDDGFRLMFVAGRGLNVIKDIPIEKVERMSKPFKQIK